MSRILIAYFSRAGENYVDGALLKLRIGNTAFAAQAAESLTGGEAFKIDPAQPFSAEYETCLAQAKTQLEQKALPALAALPSPELLEDCRFLILCYPNYWDTLPRPVCTFLQLRDWAGVTILPLCTHEGSGLGRSETDLAALCPGATVLPGLAIKGSRTRNCTQEVEIWLRGSGVPLEEE